MDAVEYSIGVNNRFGLLADDEEPSDSVVEPSKSAKDKKDKKTRDARSVKDAKPQQSKKEKEAVNEETRKDARDNKKGGRVAKDGVKRENEKNTKLTNGPHREDRENIPPRGGKPGFNRRRENEGHTDGDSPAKDDKREAGSMGFGGRGRAGRGGNGGRGGRGGFDRGRGRKREFERRSGSDRSGPEEGSRLATRRSVKPQEKREGGGSYNWGNPTDGQEEEIFDQEKRSTEWAESSPEAEDNNQKPEGQDGDAEDAEEEKEPKEMTLEEWKELQGKFRAKISYEVRKPGEGEKKGQWKNTHMLQQKAEEEDRQQLMYEERLKTSGRVKQKVTGIHFDFVNPESKNQEPRRGGRGGRGGGGRGRGGGRGSSRGRGRGGGSGGGGGGGFGGGFGGGNRDGGNSEFEINQEEFPTL